MVAEPRYGASLDIRFEKTVEEFVDFLAGHGLGHIEVRQGYVDVNGDDFLDPLARLVNERDLSVTFHAPHIDCAMGNVNERLRAAAVESVKRSLDMAAAVGAGGVVVHGGSSRRRYPDRVQSFRREQAVASIRQCAAHAAVSGVPLCLENSRETPTEHRHTSTPDRLAAFLGDVDADPEHLRVTLDVGHAKASDIDYREFVKRFGERIHIVHLHDNDGTGDDHDPLPTYRNVAAEVVAPYNVLEMKSLADITTCVQRDS